MRTLGLIGGMSWVSTAEYYRLINQLVAERRGGLHSAPLLLESVDFAEIEHLKLAGRWEAVAERLSAAAVRLEQAGAEAIVLCTNTMHHVADSIETALSVPFVHIADATAAAVQQAGLDTVGLLGTAFTMEQPFYRDRMTAHGITALTPDAEDRAEVSRIIYEELCHDRIIESSRLFYRSVADRLVAEGAQGVILGCTEVELLLGPDDVNVPTFATTRLHAEAAVTFALGEEINDLRAGA